MSGKDAILAFFRCGIICLAGTLALACLGRVSAVVISRRIALAFVGLLVQVFVQIGALALECDWITRLIVSAFLDAIPGRVIDAFISVLALTLLGRCIETLRKRIIIARETLALIERVNEAGGNVIPIVGCCFVQFDAHGDVIGELSVIPADGCTHKNPVNEPRREINEDRHLVRKSIFLENRPVKNCVATVVQLLILMRLTSRYSPVMGR